MRNLASFAFIGAMAAALLVRAEVDRAIAEMRHIERRSRRDIVAAGERDAALSSARAACFNGSICSTNPAITLLRL